MKKIFYLFFLIFWSCSLQAQFNYPVTCTPLVQPKYSLKWSEISTNTEMFKVHLLLKDLTKTSVEAYLKIRLSGVGVDIHTIDGFIPARTIKLFPGQPVLLNATDLAEYFNISNIEVNGIDISALYAGGKLPEGLYTWYVEAYEIDRNRQVSNTGQALMTVFKNYPPIINIPQEGAILPVSSPQNVLMSWTSRSTASLNAAAGKTYTLRIYELSSGDDPNVVANSGITPFREITTTNPFYNYSAADPALNKGKRYAIQVQEADINGSDDYENEGKSQVVTFSFGKPCLAPQDLIVNPIRKGRVELTWIQADEETPVTVWYKSAGSSVWNSIETTKQSAVISNLTDKTKYQFKVSSDCGTPTAFAALAVGDEETEGIELEIDDSEFDEEKEALDPQILDPYTIGIELNADGTTRTVQKVNDILSKIIKPKCVNDKVSTYDVCSPSHPIITVDGTEELTDLAVGDVLGIYDYAVLVTATNGRSPFSGKGLVKIPYLNDSYLAVEFSDVKAKKANATEKGGCVYEVPDGNFFVRNIGQKGIEDEKINIISEIIRLTDPTVFHGNLGKAVDDYTRIGSAAGGNPTPQQRQDLGVVATGIKNSVGSWKDKFTDAFPDSRNPKVKEIMDDMDAITRQLEGDIPTIKAGPGCPVVGDMKKRIDDIIAKIKALQEEENTETSPKIKNVLVASVGYDNSTITWQGDERFTKYVVTYKTADGGELVEIVNSNRLTLKNLQENSQYGFKIAGYVGDELVDTYQNGEFKTLTDEVPKPENLTYEAISDSQVKIKWDYNKVHAGYSLTYKDIFGVIRTVYPTKNEVILDNINPAINYEYDIFAFNQLKKNSKVATSNFLLASACTISIMPSKSIIKAGEQIELTVKGCAGVIKWFNGSAAISITVSPTTTQVFSVECIVAKGACTSQKEIIVQTNPICNDFAISAIPNPVNYGKSILITAQNCSGKMAWSGIAESFTSQSEYSIELFPSLTNTQKTKNYTAYCLVDGVSCPASIKVDLAGCFLEVNPIKLSGTPLIFGIGNQELLVSASCSVGSLFVSFQDESERGLVHKPFPDGKGDAILKDPIGEVDITITCRDGVGILAPVLCQKVITYPSTKNKCKNFSASKSTTKEKKYQLYASECSVGNTLTWKNQLPGEELTGNNVIVIPPKAPTVYEVTCGRTGCLTTIQLEPLKPMDIQIEYLSSCEKTYGYAPLSNGMAQIKILNNDCSITSLRATCKNGNELTWLSNIGYTEKISSIGTEIYNQITATEFPENEIYTATCQDEDGINKSINVEIIRESNRCINLSKVPSEITLGQKIEIVAKNCVGTIQWEKEELNITTNKFGNKQLLSTTHTLSDSPSLSAQYTVTCEGTPKCSETFMVKVKPCNLQTELTFNSKKLGITDVVKIGSEITSTIKGCEAGKLVWKYDNQSIEGNPVILKPYGSNGSNFTKYEAECLVNGSKLCSTSFSIIVDKTPPAKLECPTLNLQGQNTITRCQSATIEIRDIGCPVGSIYTWNGGNPTQENSYKTTINRPTTIKVTCSIYGNTAESDFEIKQVEPTPSVEETTVYAGVIQFLNAKGCPSTDCKGEGKYSWYKDNNLIGVGKTLQVQILENTTYQIKCNNGKSENISITVKEVTGCLEDVRRAWSLQGQKYICAFNCDSKFPIEWYSVQYPSGTTSLVDKNIKCLQISENSSVSYVVSCTYKGKPCKINYWANLTLSTSVSFSTLIGNNSEDGSSTNQTNPNPCNAYAYAKRKTSITVNTGDNPLIDRMGCPGVLYVNGGGLNFSVKGDEWFQLLANKTVTYTLNCDLKGDGKNICDWGTHKVNYKPSTPKGSQTSTPSGRIASAAAETTSCTFNTPQVIQGVLQTALCQSIKLMEVNGVLNRDKVASVLADLETSMKAEYAKQGITIVFPADKTAIINQIIASNGDCGSLATPAGALAAGTQGTLPAGFNPASGYGVIINSVIPKLPTLTASVTAASCGLNNGSVKLTAKDGTPPYQYSKDGTTYQSTDTFETLAVGKYTFYVKDSKGEKGSLKVEILDKNAAEFENIIALSSARIASVYDIGRITVRWGTTGAIKEITFRKGIKGSYQNDILIIDEPLTMQGKYLEVYNANNHDEFLGFYKEGFTGPPCTPSYDLYSGGKCTNKILCAEGFLEQKAFYKGWFFDDHENKYFSNEYGDLASEIDELITQLMTQNQYTKYIKDVKKDGKYTLEELTDLKQTLIDYKDAQLAAFGATSTSLLDKLIEYFKNCDKPTYSDCVVGDAIFPRCWWDNPSFGLATSSPLPFSAGVIDGAYSTLKGAAMTISSFEQLAQCWLNPVMYFWDIRGCSQTRASTMNVIGFVGKLIEGDTQSTNTLSTMKTQLGLDWDTWKSQTFCIGNTPAESRCCEYHQGKLFFDIASLFFGIGEANAALKGAKVAQISSEVASKMSALFAKISIKNTGLLLKPIRNVGLGILTASVVALTDPAVALKPISAVEHVIVKTVGVASSASIIEAESIAAKGLATVTAEAAGMIKGVPSVVDNVVFGTQDIVLSKLSMGDILFSRADAATKTIIPFAIMAVATGVVSSVPAKETNNCSICTGKTISQNLCDKLKLLQTRGGTNGTTGVTKLCNSLTTNLEIVVDKLLTLQDIEIQAFFKDIILSPCSNAHLCGNINNIDVATINSWKVLYDAITACTDCDVKRQTDWATLTKVKLVLNETDLLNTLQTAGGGISGAAALSDIIAKNKYAGCKVCLTTQSPNLEFLPDYLSSIENFVTYYGNLTGASKVLGNQGIRNGGYKQVEATAFILKVLNSNEYIATVGNSNITSFEYDYDDVTNSDCTADIVTNNELVECKSWSLYNANTWGGMPNNQFLTYLANISSMSGLQYWFDADKADLASLKTKFQTIFQKTDANGDNIVFEKIWTNTPLKVNLFPINNTEALKPQAFIEYNNMVNTKDSKLFKIIKVK